ncbi:MarR family winged helix-turn-helix transcriptional regulator [soil metagenome]
MLMMTRMLRELDERIIALRVYLHGPQYRRLLLTDLDIEGGVGSLRILRAVERRTTTTYVPSIGDIALELGVEHSTASRAVDAAAKSGLLRKAPAAEDLRRSQLEISSGGLAILSAADERRLAMLAEVTSGWEQSDIDQLAHLLERLQTGFDRLDGDA